MECPPLTATASEQSKSCMKHRCAWQPWTPQMGWLPCESHGRACVLSLLSGPQDSSWGPEEGHTRTQPCWDPLWDAQPRGRWEVNSCCLQTNYPTKPTQSEAPPGVRVEEALSHQQWRHRRCAPGSTCCRQHSGVSVAAPPSMQPRQACSPTLGARKPKGRDNLKND